MQTCASEPFISAFYCLNWTQENHICRINSAIYVIFSWFHLDLRDYLYILPVSRLSPFIHQKCIIHTFWPPNQEWMIHWQLAVFLHGWMNWWNADTHLPQPPPQGSCYWKEKWKWIFLCCCLLHVYWRTTRMPFVTGQCQHGWLTNVKSENNALPVCVSQHIFLFFCLPTNDFCIGSTLHD